MASVDDRIVAMQFDNSAFESKLSTTMSSLDKLKGSLDFANSKKGLDDLSTSGKNFNLDGIGSAVEGISNKFSAMGAVAFTIIQDITSRAIAAGEQIVKSLSVGQVMSGFHEYETNMNAIQTVLANTRSKGTSLDDVNKALDQLNTYSDLTIYNFSEMAKNVGTFTAAGVGLDTSVQSIKGIANLAAMSGSNADQASTGMYQLSQAIASGTVKLMDWNSVQNAGMGGEVFQKALFETGKTLGTLKDVPIDQTFEQWTKAGNTFRGSLADGWITSEVLTNTLAGFTGDLTDAQLLSMGYNAAQVKEIQATGKAAKDAATVVKTLTQLVGTVKESIGSGWTKTFQIIFGTFDEAKVTFTDFYNSINKVVGASADARNNLLQDWKDLGGRTVLIDTVKDAFIGLGSILKPIKEAFRNVFPPMTGKRLFDLTQSLHDLISKLTLSEPTAKSVKRIFEALFSSFKMGIEVVKGIFGVFGDLFKRFSGGESGGILAFFTKIADKIMDFSNKMKFTDGIAVAFDELSKHIQDFIYYFVTGFSGMGTSQTSGILLFANKVGLAVRDLKGFLSDFKTKAEEFISFFIAGFTDMGTNEGEGILLFANRAGMALKSVKDFLSDARTKIEDFISYFISGFTGMGTNEGEGILLFASKAGAALKSVKDWILKIFDAGPFDKIKGAFSDISGSFDGFSGVADTTSAALERVKDRLGWVSDVGHALGKVWDWLSSKFGAIGDALGKFGSFLKETFSGLPSKIAEIMKKGDYNQVLDTVNVGIFAAIALAFKKFTSSFSGFGKGLFGNVNQAFSQLTSTLQAMQTNIKADALLKIAAAVGILTVAMVILSLMDSGALTKSLTAMAIGFGQLVTVMALLNKITSGPKAAAQMAILAAGLILLAAAMLVLALAMKIFSTMSWDELSKGFAGVAGGLGIMIAAVNLLPSDTAMVKAGIGIMAIATGMLILALAMKTFATMSWEELAKGLAGVAGGLGLIVAAMNLLPKGMMSKSAGLIAVAVALNILALAVLSFGSMDLKTMVQGLIGIGAALLIIAGAMNLMPNGILLTLQGAGLLMIGIGLIAISASIAILGHMSWENMSKGLVGIAGALIILAVAAHNMQDSGSGALAIAVMSVSMLLLANALEKIGGLSWGEIAKGLVAIGASLAIIVIASHLVEPATPALLGLGVALLLLGGAFALFGLGASLLATAFALIATSGTQGVAVLLVALEGLIKMLPAFIAAFADGMILLAKKVVEALPGIITGLDKALKALIQLVIDNIPGLGEALRLMITEGLKTLRETFPDVVATGLAMLIALLTGVRDNIYQITTLVVDIITGFLDALSEKVPQIIDSVYNLLMSIIKGVIEKLADIVTVLLPKGLELLQGLWNGITQGAEAVWSWFIGLPAQILGWLGDLATWLKEKGLSLIGGLLLGLAEKILEVLAWFTKLPLDILGWIGDVVTKLLPKGLDFIGGLLSGLVEAIPKVMSWFIGLPGDILGWIGDVAGKLKDKGWDFIKGFIEGYLEKVKEVMTWFQGLPGDIIGWIGDVLPKLTQKGLDFLAGLMSGLESGIIFVTDWFKAMPRKVLDWIESVGGKALTWLVNIGKDIIQGIWDGMKEVWKKVTDWLSNLNPLSHLGDIGILDGHGILLLVPIGQNLMIGLHNGLKEGWLGVTNWLGSLNPTHNIDLDLTTKSISSVLEAVTNQLGNLDEFNPTITPVLDLTKVQQDASKLGSILGISSLNASVSYDQASSISSSTVPKDDVSTVITPSTSTQIKFEQNNYSPEALSTTDIYRQTKNQIAMAKKELALV